MSKTPPVAVAKAAIEAMFDELDHDERASVLAAAMSGDAGATVKAIALCDFARSDAETIGAACAKRFDLTPADLSAAETSTLIGALEGRARGEGLSDDEVDSLLCIAGAEGRPEVVAKAIAQMRAGDVEAAEATLDDGFPGAALDAAAHAGRCRMLFNLGGGR